MLQLRQRTRRLRFVACAEVNLRAAPRKVLDGFIADSRAAKTVGITGREESRKRVLGTGYENNFARQVGEIFRWVKSFLAGETAAHFERVWVVAGGVP